MARFNEVLVGRFNNGLRKALGMKGAAPAPQVGGELMPILDLTNLPVEERFLYGWDRFGAQVSAVAAAGQRSSFLFRNPLNSNLIVVIEKVVCIGTLQDQPFMQMGTTNTDFATIMTTIQRLDARTKRVSSAAVLSFQSLTGLLTQTIIQVSYPVNSGADFIVDEHQEVTILPGDAINVVSNVLNQSLNCSLIWRERFLEESERQ